MKLLPRSRAVRRALLLVALVGLWVALAVWVWSATRTRPTDIRRVIVDPEAYAGQTLTSKAGLDARLRFYPP